MTHRLKIRSGSDINSVALLSQHIQYHISLLLVLGEWNIHFHPLGSGDGGPIIPILHDVGHWYWNIHLLPPLISYCCII